MPTYKSDNLMASVINYTDTTKLGALIFNQVFKKCVMTLSTCDYLHLSHDIDKYLYYSKLVFYKWITNFHYPLLQSEKMSSTFESDFYKWYNSQSNVKNIQWDIFNSLSLYYCFDFIKALQYHMIFRDIYDNFNDENRIIDNCDPTFLQLREITWKYINKLQGKDGNVVDFDSDTKKKDYYTNKVGIGKDSDRTNKTADANHLKWNHTGTFCNESFKKSTLKSPFNDFLKKIDSDAPIQCGISLSTNAILSTIIWGTSTHSLSKQELSTIILYIFSLLCLDGGHTSQEVLSAVGILANFYYYYPDKTMYNKTTITNLFLLMKPIEFLPTKLLTKKKLTENLRLRYPTEKSTLHTFNQYAKWCLHTNKPIFKFYISTLTSLNYLSFISKYNMNPILLKSKTSNKILSLVIHPTDKKPYGIGLNENLISYVNDGYDIDEYELIYFY